MSEKVKNPSNFDELFYLCTTAGSQKFSSNSVIHAWAKKYLVHLMSYIPIPILQYGRLILVKKSPNCEIHNIHTNAKEL